MPIFYWPDGFQFVYIMKESNLTRESWLEEPLWKRALVNIVLVPALLMIFVWCFLIAMYEEFT